MIGRPSQCLGCGREAHSEVLEWSGGPPKGPGVVGRPSLRSEHGRKALLEDLERSGDTPGGL